MRFILACIFVSMSENVILAEYTGMDICVHFMVMNMLLFEVFIPSFLYDVLSFIPTQ